ncbi:MAG: HigA family addiction module antitoxin [Sulfuricaulis sp.]|nr:HigA family addiction module antitoxin [Sulfuricaulis sp.]
MKTLRDPKRRPTRPGEILRLDVLPALGITQGEFARRLDVSRLTVSELLREKRAVSPDMALRLAPSEYHAGVLAQHAAGRGLVGTGAGAHRSLRAHQTGEESGLNEQTQGRGFAPRQADRGAARGPQARARIPRGESSGQSC